MKQRALAGDLTALNALRNLGALSGNRSKYNMAPVSYAQRRLWFIDKMDESPAYNLPAVLLLEGKLDAGALENAFGEIIRRHEILRTCFVETDGIPYQKIFEESEFKLPIVDLTNVSDQEVLVANYISEESKRYFDLSKGPLLVGRLLKIAESSYMLLFNMHHIISDGWSIGVLISELTLLYNTYCKGGTNPLPSLKIQYKDYVRRNIQILKEEGTSNHKSYWLDKLTGEHEVLELPTELPRPLHKTFAGKLHEIGVDKQLHAQVKDLCIEHNVSLFMFLVSVVNILLHKYTGKSDVLLGSPIAGREQRDLEDQIGFYVNTIPLRNEVNATLRFKDFLTKVRQNCIEAYEHQVYPFDMLVEDLNLVRDTSRNPLFEIVLSLQEENSGLILFEGIKTTLLKPDITYSKFDLHFDFKESAEGMKLGIIYNPDIYGSKKIERLGNHLLVLLQNILNSPHEAISNLEIISPTETAQIQNVFNHPASYYPKEQTIASLFEEIAGKYPDQPAVVYQGKPLTYSDLNRKANAMAHYLTRRYQVSIDEPVVLLMDRSPELVVAILGVLKAGGAYLPIDTKMPLDRINFILEDAGARIVIADFLPEQSTIKAPSVLQIDQCLLLTEEEPDRPFCAKSSSDLAYILYTSGSTGSPKGSMVEEKSVIRLVRNTNYMTFGATDRIFSTSSISFDATTLDLWGALLNGGTLYLENMEDYLDPGKLALYFSEYRISKAVMTTGLFERMVEADQLQDLKMFSGIGALIVGGDRLPVQSANKMIEMYPDLTLINGYGPTENTTFTTCFRVTREFEREIPIGKPISNSTVYILDISGNLCPIGVPGEIFIGGDGLSRGYINRPELNDQKFVADPFNKEGKLYRSGDMAMWAEDGNIVFLGRTDDQLKIRGFRIETGEIENVASQFEGIILARVVVIREEDQKQLALYFTSAKEINTKDFKRELAEKLPEYMLPKYIIHLGQFPLNQNGKVDLKALPKPVLMLSPIVKSIESANPTEKILVRIFEDILNVRNISLTDNFFGLGGHSLKAIRAVSAIQKELSVKVSLKEFFANPDIQALEEIIRNKKRESLGIIPVIAAAPHYNLSHAQKRLWVLDKIEKSNSTYNIPLAVTIYDEVDLIALQSAFDDLIHKHESLRTIFIEIEGDPFQKIVNDSLISIATFDFSEESNPDESAFNFVVAEAHRPFVLSEFPLVRLHVIKTAERQHIMFLNIHHIVCDGWSLNTIVGELFGAYRNRLQHLAQEPVLLPLQYKDYAYWLNGRISQPESYADRTYWLGKLGGEIVPLDIPSDFRRPVVKSYRGDSVLYPFPKELKQNLDQFNLEKRSSLFMTLVAALKVLLYKYSGKEDVIIGTPVVGRDHPDLENQVGYYVNTLALRDQVRPDKSFAELLADVKKTATDGYSHQMYPFDRLVEEIKLPRDTSRSPLFDVMVVLQNFDISYLEVFKKIGSYHIPMNMSKFDLTFTFNDSGENLELVIEYNTQLYRRERIDQIASHLVVLLESVIVNPAQELRIVNILGKEEENNLLYNYNDSAAGYPDDKNIVQLFEEIVLRYPFNPAVVCKNRELSYAALNSKANRLARYLKEHHAVAPGEAIGVLVPPTENTIVVLLAILKSGGAYVPIDPEYPDERIKHILSESRTKIFLTQHEQVGRLARLAEEVEVDCQVLNLDDLWGMNGQNDSNLVGINADPDTNAYIIFTSGSTGKPKGCQISHRNLVRLFVNDKSNFDFTSADVWILSFSYCFDFSVWEMYGALLFGGKLIIPDRGEVRDVSAFVRLVSEQKVTVLNQTPGAFYKFIDVALESRISRALSIRYIIFGGEKLNPSKLLNWVRKYPAGEVKLINMYGITETTIHVTYHRLTDEEIISTDGASNIGVPLPETKVYLFDNHRMLSPVGVYGEMYVAGTGLSKGYMNRPDLTADRFVPNPYNSNEIVYKSGDVARWLYDGTMEYLDRCDNQVQIRGFRVEMTEIELQLRLYSGIVDAVVVANDKEGTKELVAYVVSAEELRLNALRNFLSASLPDYMVPTYFVRIDKIPLTSNGKLDKKALPPAIQNIATDALFENPSTSYEEALLELWQEVLSTETISIHDNFFDLGGNSILLVKLHGKINALYPDVIELTDLFSKGKIAEQAEFISQKIASSGTLAEKADGPTKGGSELHDLAVVGIASRIGDCETPDELWEDLCLGVDFIGEMPATRIPDIQALSEKYNRDPESLKFREYCYLKEVDKFDCGFFKLSPSEAALIDPGQRMFMETAYHALEDAGYGGNKLWGSRTGVFIGASDNLGEYSRYVEFAENADPNLLLVAQTPSILASRLSYHLNLKGPALLVDTACSSSLVALHLACRSIREGTCDSAIVGGIKVHLLPFDSGSRIEIDSSDSRAHSFDDSANGTGAGEGIIAIYLKPLQQALNDHDHVYAVIKGSEINQDGNSIGITAPNADAQAEAIENAWRNAGIDPKTISFIETHGTATKLGDPIEIDGITKAFARYTSEKSICAIGAIKANTGHLDTAAGLAGFLKAVLSLKYRKLTPLVHFKAPNRNINFEGSAAFVNRELKNWERNGSPLRCGVSSFGLSGTNCHVVLEEAPDVNEEVIQDKRKNLFVLSSRSKEGLAQYARTMKQALYLHQDTNPGNICYTLATGRGHFPHRLAIVFENWKDLIDKLSQIIEKELGHQATESVFYGYSKAVASNKKNMGKGEIPENELRKLSHEINALLLNLPCDGECLQKVAQSYLTGCDISWEDFYAPAERVKVSLPGYPFEKKRCWVKLKENVREKQQLLTSYSRKYESVFLKNCILETPAVAVYATTFHEDDWLLSEHRVMGTPTLVGVSYLQMAFEAGKNHLNCSRLRFEDFYLLQPLTLSNGKTLEFVTTIARSEDQLQVEVQSKSTDDDWTTYARFNVSKIEVDTIESFDIEAIKDKLSNSRGVVPRGVDEGNEEMIQVSTKWNCLQRIYWKEAEFLAELIVPEEDEALASGFFLYPPLIDAAVSFAIDESGFLPYSFGTVELYKRASGKMYSYVRKQQENSSETRIFDIFLTDENGEMIAFFKNFTLKKIAQQKQYNLFHELIWKIWPLEKNISQIDHKIAVFHHFGYNSRIVDQLGSTKEIAFCEIVEDNYNEIFEQFPAQFPDKIIFILPAKKIGIGDGITWPEDRFVNSLSSVFNLAKYLSANVASKLDLLFVGENVNEVTGDEHTLDSLANAVAGLGQVMQQEMPNIRCRFLDVDEQTNVSEILMEVETGFAESYFLRANRGGTRYVREIKPMVLESRELSNVTYQEGGVYLVTGGTGGIGLELAHYLAKQAKVKLALMNRTEFPPEAAWDAILLENRDQKLSRKIAKILEIRKEGSEVYFYTADVGEYDQLLFEVENIRKELGRISGVVHAAGVAGEGFIFGKEPETFRAVIRPKIQGTSYLFELLKHDKPDFFVMTSAITAIAPTSGQSDYTAANCFMDAYAAEMNRAGMNATSINLTAWADTGMAYEHGVAGDGIFKSIASTTAVAAIGSLMKRKIPSVVLGEPDLTGLTTAEGLPFFLDEEMLVPVKRLQRVKAATEQRMEVVLHGNENGHYSDSENSIAQIWGTVLGYGELNLTDNYYDLGGDSIHAIKINTLLEKRLRVQVTIGDLFNHLTIAELAAFLDSKAIQSAEKPQETSEIADILPTERRSNYPVSSAQRRLFILDQLTKDKLNYHLPEVWNIKGQLDVEAFIQAFSRLVQRHEILRTSIEFFNEEPVQVVHDTIDFNIPVSKMNEPEARDHIRCFVQPFDLGVAPLFRTEIILLSPDNCLILFDSHHIILDAFSLEILKRELFGLYEGEELEPLRFQYRDYSVWQGNYYQSKEAIAKKAYWISQFQGEIPVLNLPMDYPRSADQSTEAGVFSLCLDEGLTAEIKQMSSRYGISTFMILLGVYNIVLHKYAQQEDVIIGVSSMGRDNDALSKLLGMFVNNLPVRSFPRGEISILEFLNEVKEAAIQASANQDYPFDELIEDLNIKRDLNRTPLFDVVFSYMNFALTEQKNGKLQVSDFRAETVISSEYDLMLYGLEAEEKIYITIKYKKSLFKRERIERFAGHFTRVVEVVTRETELKLSDIDLLLPSEMERLKLFNSNYSVITQETEVLDLFRESFSKNPERIALLHKERSMTYGEMNSRVNKLANYLQSELSVEPDDLVCIMTERTETMVIAMLGVLKSGAAYVGIDSTYPPQRIDYILKDSGAKILLTESEIHQKESFSVVGAIRVIDLDDPALDKQDPVEPKRKSTPENLAYVIYTSGSTGAPKGVAITHKNLSIFLHFCLEEFKSTPYELMYAAASYCFDLSVYEIIFPLVAGKGVRILKSALEIPDYLGNDDRVLINLVPSSMLTIVDELDKGKFKYLSAVNLGGEQIPQTLIDRIDCDRLEVRNLYGPSEDTTYSTLYRFSNKNNKVLIGKPLANTQIFIVDRDIQLVPLGHPGEICIAGDGLARGYLNKEELTKEKFIRNPFGDGRLYKTGDLGKWTDSGDLEYLGRMDRQVKIRGFRIELGEIEINILRYPAIEHAVVVAVETDSIQDIVAYIVAQQGLDVMELKSYLGKLLPAFMVPLYIVQLDKIPLTPNGKIDMKALPRPQMAIPNANLIEKERLNPTEEALLEIWKSVLGIENLSKHANFFDLGGHSLKALRLLSQINRQFECKCLLTDVFEFPTIALFAAIIRKQSRAGERALVPLKKADFYEVSHAQHRLWILDRVEKNSIAYNIPIVYSLKGAVDIQALQQAFCAIIRKFESLRTYFVEIDGEPWQGILDEFEFAIEIVEVNVENELIPETKEFIQQRINTPFKLTKAPLMKVTLFKDKALETYVLVLNIHHIVLDEWSVDILADHLTLFYEHFAGKNILTDQLVFEPSSIQYKEFAHWHNQQISANEEDANLHRKYWLEMFDEPVPCLDLPSDFQRPKTQTFEGKTESFKLPADLSEGLRRLGAENNATLFITSLALFHVLFSKYTGQKDIVIGTPIANRDHQEFQNQIGFFLNTLALRNRSDEADSFLVFLDQVRKSTLEAYHHQMYPFDLLVDGLELPRDLSRSPLFDVMLIAQTPIDDRIKSLAGLEMTSVEFDYPVSKFDLSISFYDDGNGINYYFEYNTALFRRERIVKMFDHFACLVENLLSNVQAPVSQLSMVSFDEKAQLSSMSVGVEKLLENQSIVTLIENKAAEFSDRIAVVYKRKRLTYQEINGKANQLARYLIENQGIKPGALVGVMLDRSEWSVVAMMAILKSGGVYVPVDANYPQSRIDFILKDSGSEILITTDDYKKLTTNNTIKIVSVGNLDVDLSAHGVSNLTDAQPADLAETAYVIYTSGSTGAPKGVLGTHKCLLNLVEWQSEHIEGGLKSLQYAPHNFDVSVQEILFSLATAGTLYMIENETRYKISLVADMVETEGLEMVTMPYSALNLFLGEIESIAQLKSLKHIITSGEQPFVNATLAKLLKAYPGILFHNQYGPSETHVVTSHTLSGLSEVIPNKIPIGRPICNTQIYLLDKQMEFVPRGIRGDLYIGGFNVANGYLNKADLTDERFVANPFGDGKLYRSGDTARWDLNGDLEFLGRDDGQVKVRGYRIELGEIESCLLDFPDLKEVVVKIFDEGDNKEIAAYFTTSADVGVARLKAYLAAQLPGYMIPGYFIRLEEFPHTPSGKIDLRLLPVPEANTDQFESSFIEPVGETEQIIAKVWSEILQRDRIGAQDNFFEIGGNSIKAIKVMSRIQKQLGKKTFLNLIFQHPTIRQMAEIILGTDDRLKKMDTDWILLNQEHGKKIFFLPPGIGYSFAYLEYAKYFENYSVYGLNFVESLDPAGSMAEILIGLQDDGPFYLFGHSAGGNMAYDVAVELQRQGREVGGIILLDSYRQFEIIDWSSDEYLNDAILYIEQNHAEFLDEEIKEAALKKIVAYRKHLNARSEDKFVNCTIFQIEASDEITNFNKNISRTAWIDLASHFEVFEGSGGHMDMLKQPNLERNALLTGKLLDRLYFEQNAMNLIGNYK